jgi:hypothetical protein
MMKKNKYRVRDNVGHYQGSRWYFLEENIEKGKVCTTIGGFRDENLAIRICKFLNEQEVNDEWSKMLEGTTNFELFKHDHGF